MRLLGGLEPGPRSSEPPLKAKVGCEQGEPVELPTPVAELEDYALVVCGLHAPRLYADEAAGLFADEAV